MGAWGTGIFDNDTAADWASEVAEANDLSFIESTLDRVLEVGGEYLDGSDAEEGLAAAEALTRLFGNGGKSNAYSEDLDQWVKSTRIKPTPQLRQKGLMTIDRILAANSELVELWQESDEFEDWKSVVMDLRGRLTK
jgi:hypothetical protein